MEKNFAFTQTISQRRAIISSCQSGRWFILATVLLGATMSALDVSIVNVAMPAMKRMFEVSMETIEWVAIAYMLTLTIFLPLFGRLADMYGRYKLYNAGFFIFSIGSVLCGLSPSAGFLIGSRVLQAIGAGLLQANSVAIITHAFPAHERGKAIGIQGAVQAIAMGIAPFLGGILITAVGWRAIFYVNIPIGILGTLAAMFILPKNEKKTKEPIDYLGAALFASGLACLLLGLNKIIKLGWESHTVIAYFICGFILLSIFVITELKVRHPLIDLKLLKNSAFLLGNISGMFSYYVLFAVMFLMPFYLERVCGYRVTLTGLLLTSLMLAMAVTAPLSGYVSDKYGSRIITTSGMIISAIACALLFFMGESPHMPSLVGIMMLLGLGMGIFIPSNNSAIMSTAPSEKLGIAGGLLNMTRSLGLIFGVNISGIIFTTLEHNYLSEEGFMNASRIFSNSNIPMLVKDDAFMHGFTMVILSLIAVNVLAAFISALKKGEMAGVVDHDMTGAVVISSGFFNGFSQEITGMTIVTTVLLLAVYTGIFAIARLRPSGVIDIAPKGISSLAELDHKHGPPALDPKSLALQYYVNKYHDSNVSIDIRPYGINKEEADVRKYGFLVKRLIVKGDKVTEKRRGMGQWAIDELFLTN